MSTVTKDTAGELKDRYVERLREEVDDRRSKTKAELGEIAVEVVEEYFPETVMKRRRRDLASGFLLGAIAGFLVRHALSRR